MDEDVTIREKFAIADIGSVILSLGRLLRSGWQLGHTPQGPNLTRDACQVPIKLRRNTLTVLAMISTIAACAVAPVSTFDDKGRLPPAAEECAQTPGWHILASGLPLFLAHRVQDIDLEACVWSVDDWS